MIVDLPCGILHNEEVYDKVRVKEITGKQQNYLMDMELVVDNLGHVPKLLLELTEEYQTAEGKPLDMEVKEAMWKLPTEDVECILIKIREATYGAKMSLPVQCPHCGKEQNKRLDLDKLEISSLKNKKKRTKKVKLLKTKQTAEVKLLYLQDLFDLYKVLRDKSHSLYTGTLHLSVAKLGGKENVTEEDLMDLPVTDLNAIEEGFSNLRGSVDTMVTHDCESCEKEFDSPLPVMDPSFFVQSQTPKT